MSVTLAIVGNTNHSLMKFAVEKTRRCVPVDVIKVFSDRDIGIPNSEFHKLPDNFGLYEYSTFMIKQLNDYIETDHVLICQYDGFAINKEFWSDKFLQYDYIGSATHYRHSPLHTTLTECKLIDTLQDSWYSLGGGFCLRSKKLLNALSDPEVKENFYNYAIDAAWSCEDITIGIIYKKFLEDTYGIKYGSLEDSIEFAAEILTGYDYCLGFHGWHQAPIFLSEDETIYYINEYLKSNDPNKVSIPKIRSFLGHCYIKQYKRAVSHIRNIYSFL